ncbi:MAG: murein biosynthesis integral membrane protein MurJ [Solirubrobacterales bacterium]|nr:murein biosynthesis integral membrane protein MurJ [Solirubrobacterales bacterium]
MTEWGDGEKRLRGEPPVPPEPFDPSTREFPAVRPEEVSDPGRPFVAPGGDAEPEGIEDDLRVREAERIERRHEAVSMDTSSFMAIPAPTPTTPFVPPEFDERAGRLGRSTAFFSIATAFSRVAGLVREIVAASYFGIKGPMSAFTIAFQVPNLVRSLFADAAIQAAFVPVFTEELEKGNKREAFRLASTLIYLVTLVLGAITAIFVLAAPLVTPIFAPGFSGAILDLTVTLSQILFPILIMLGATGMVVGILNSYDRFAAFAISPFFWNLVIILVLVLLEPAFHGNDRIYAYAIGVLVGTAVQLAIPAWDLRNTPFRPTLSMDWHLPDVRRVLLLMLPVTLSLGLINFDLLLNSIVGTLVSDQAPAAIDKAFRIYMLPQGIFSVAVATVTFPTLARFAARREWDDLRATMSNGMRQILLLLIPAAAAVLVLSVPMTRLVYQRGEFDAAQTHLVAQALFWFAFSLPFNGLYLMLTRTFFSLQRPWVPTAVAGSNLVVDIIFSFALYSPFGIGGVVAATVIATVSSVVAQSVILRRQLHGLELGRLVATAARVLAAAALLAAVSYLVWYGLDQALGRSTVAQIISLGAGLAAGSAAYFAAVLALRVPEAGQIMRLVRRI